MEPSVDRINSVLRPALKNRIGTQENVYGARALAQKEWNTTSLSAGQLAYALVLDTVLWCDNNVKDVFIPVDAVDDNVVQMIGNICLKADSTHGKGSKAVAGAAVGLNFGVLGALVGATFGWAIGQNAANNDLQSVVMYANQAIDYLCDVLCNKIKEILNNVRGPVVEQKPQIDTSSTPKQVPIDEDAEKKLNELIGLSSIKRQVLMMKASLKKQKVTGNKINLHMCFYGNPGTGKTEVARLIGKIFYNEGILENQNFVETDRSGLVAEYIGQTAIKTHETFKKAMGGVLFIDEAYALDGGYDNDFGKEAVAALLKDMEDYRDKVCVILAGYKEPMDKMFDLNPGFKSRVNRYIEFPNYNRDEMREILLFMAKKAKYSIEQDALEKMLDIIMAKSNDKNFSNAREARNVLDSIIDVQALRTENDLHNTTIKLEDVCEYIKYS